MTHDNPYAHFDDIVCINLDFRTEKKQGTQEIFDMLNIPGRFHTVQRHAKGGMYGCFESHVQVIQEAYDKGLSNLLVFEDDIKLTPGYSKEKLIECIKFMKSNVDWDLFYLGYFPSNNNHGGLTDFFNAPFITNDIIKYSPLANHAYCVSRKGMKNILENYKRHIGSKHFDFFIVSLKLNCFCLIPYLFDQKLCLGTDNSPTEQLEIFMRKFQCQAEELSLMYRPTLLKYNLHRNRSLCIVRITIMMFIIFILSWFISSKLNVTNYF
jgi:GR25 family glycosyltransferase involved in LPS biosynthesis